MNILVSGLALLHSNHAMVLMKEKHGKLISIGGEVEKDEKSSEALVRLYTKSTGLQTNSSFWYPCFKLQNIKGDWEVHFYKTFLQSTKDIKKGFLLVDWPFEFTHRPHRFAHNFAWLLPLITSDVFETGNTIHPLTSEEIY